METWSKVHFIDEGNLNLVESDGKCYLQRQNGERLNPVCVKNRFNLEEDALIAGPLIATWQDGC